MHASRLSNGKMSAMETTPLASLEISTGDTPDASIIWLHGLGADGNDFAPIVNELQLPIPTRFILPHAPVMPVTINGGYPMPAWYDIRASDITSLPDESGIRTSQARIEQLIARERERGIATSRILLAGFSQGGAIALHTGLRHTESLGGLIALSTYLPLQDRLASERSAANLATPIFMGHGIRDNMILPAAALASKNWLTTHGHPVAWHEYDMPHSVCGEEINNIRDFILHTLQV